jgi:hypothetical protein
MTTLPTSFGARLAAMNPVSTRKGPSRARAHIRNEFDAIIEARARGITWRQISGAMIADGLTGADGEVLTADEVRAMFHNERASRGLRKKRRTKRPAAPLPQLQAGPVPPAAPDDEDEPDPPRRRGGFQFRKATPKNP